MRSYTIVIILACIIALTATIGTIIIGSGSFEGIVVDKPYDAGLAWDKERLNHERLGWSVALQDATFTTGKNDLVVMVHDKNGTLLSDAVVSIAVSRPSTRTFDRTYRTDARQNGQYRTEINLPLYGNWGVIIEVSRNTEHTSFNKTIFAKQDKP